jgi:hypothetical protein
MLAYEINDYINEMSELASLPRLVEVGRPNPVDLHADLGGQLPVGYHHFQSLKWSSRPSVPPLMLR